MHIFLVAHLLCLHQFVCNKILPVELGKLTRNFVGTSYYVTWVTDDASTYVSITYKTQNLSRLQVLGSQLPRSFFVSMIVMMVML